MSLARKLLEQMHFDGYIVNKEPGITGHKITGYNQGPSTGYGGDLSSVYGAYYSAFMKAPVGVWDDGIYYFSPEEVKVRDGLGNYIMQDKNYYFGAKESDETRKETVGHWLGGLFTAWTQLKYPHADGDDSVHVGNKWLPRSIVLMGGKYGDSYYKGINNNRKKFHKMLGAESEEKEEKVVRKCLLKLKEPCKRDVVNEFWEVYYRLRDKYSMDEMTGAYVGRVVRNFRQKANDDLKRHISSQHTTTSRRSADYNQIERDDGHKRNMKVNSFLRKQDNPETELGKRCQEIEKLPYLHRKDSQGNTQIPDFRKEFRDEVTRVRDD